MAGLLDKRREDREEAKIPTAGMADIAFLLLIFFLVTTTINVDTGIGMTLPPKLEDQEPPPVKERNLFNILVNAQGELLVEDEQANIGQLRQRVKDHVTNFGDDPDLSVSPDDAVISIKTDSQTPYDDYIEVLDEVWMAYREIWDQMARTGQTPRGEEVLSQTYDSYEEYRSGLEPEDENQIREAFKAQISIAEPDTD
ncbi:MAG: biopolymer transporter ExbD [Salinibacter sp.]